MSNIPVGITSQPGRSFAAEDAQAQPAGQWRGESVALAGSDKSLFASAAEEMSFLRSEKKEVDLSKRKIGERSPLRAEALERALAYLEKAADLDKDKQLNPFVKQLLDQPISSSTHLRQLLQRQFEDVSQQYMALAYVRDQLRRKLKQRKSESIEQLLAMVDTALDELMDESGVAIQAGMNVTGIAASYADRQLGTLNNLRRLYRDAVLDYGSLTGTFQKILAQYGEEHFSDSLTYLISALGADLAAEGPSLPKERLEMIIEDLYKLHSLESLNDECSEFLSQLQRIYQSYSIPGRLKLMEQLLGLLEKKWLSTDQTSKVIEALNIPGDMAIYFWRGFKELIRLIPLKVYKDPFEREKLISAVQECLDLCIENEE
ncbi:SepL/TyeA/HrpJ family type III secretion system gatekeeper [Hahella sp. CCB-MM4]|uniref:type III secretion system gatekeeper subunit SctW n=1 Tax=Hahella sp. (strain CCB-MM4) TaxID=1926491 RepID=UPI000B9A20CB|nr:type III secretion system gatekeeper subunit SctW [Hahella sp. CCB-MM4]OZG74325.1 SepL/TyeA/HrpJ family type III secretion system gatekeeper [Hahella sp. CCB-MM4]